MREIVCDQRTPEWYAARVGRPTASSFSHVMTTKFKRSIQRDDYLKKLARERETGVKEESYVSNPMSRGIAMEDQAIAALSMIHDIEVRKVGFCLSDDGLYGCSPDGFVVDDMGGVEAKCPTLKIHREYLRSGRLVSKYFLQVHGCMLVTGMPWWYFVSYHPEEKPLILRVFRDENIISKMRHEILIFCKELDKLIMRKE